MRTGWNAGDSARSSCESACPRHSRIARLRRGCSAIYPTDCHSGGEAEESFNHVTFLRGVLAIRSSPVIGEGGNEACPATYLPARGMVRMPFRGFAVDDRIAHQRRGLLRRCSTSRSLPAVRLDLQLAGQGPSPPITSSRNSRRPRPTRCDRLGGQACSSAHRACIRIRHLERIQDAVAEVLVGLAAHHLDQQACTSLDIEQFQQVQVQAL